VHTCEKCGKRFIFRRGYERHVVEEHPVRPKGTVYYYVGEDEYPYTVQVMMTDGGVVTFNRVKASEYGQAIGSQRLTRSTFRY
jgi:hypothetical protein